MSPPPPPPPPPPVAVMAPSVPSPSIAPAQGYGRRQRLAECRRDRHPRRHRRSITNNQEANVDEGDIVKIERRHSRHPAPGPAVHRLAGRRPDAARGFRSTPFRPASQARATGMTRCCSTAIGSSSSATAMRAAAPRSIASGSIRPDTCASSTPIISSRTIIIRSRNYASRLIGTRLIFYSPLELNWDEDPLEALPGLRKWRPGNDESTPFRRIATASQVFIAPRMRDDREAADRHAPFGDDLQSRRADARLLGGGRARAGIAHLLRLGRRRLSLGRPSGRAATGGAANPRPFSTACPSAASGPRRSARAAIRSINSRSARTRAGPHDQRAGPRRGRRRRDGQSRGQRWRRRPAAPADRRLGRRLAQRRRNPSTAGCPARPATTGISTTASSATMSFMARGAFGEGSKAGDDLRRPGPRRTGDRRCQLSHAVDRIEALGRDALAVGERREGGLGFTAIELPPGGQRRCAATSSPCPPLPKARPAATPSSSGRRRGRRLGPARPADLARGAARLSALLRQRRVDALPAPRRSPLRARRRARRPPAGRRRRCLQGVLHRLVRQCAADLPWRPGLRFARLRAGRRPARRRRDQRDRRVNFSPAAPAPDAATSSHYPRLSGRPAPVPRPWWRG